MLASLAAHQSKSQQPKFAYISALKAKDAEDICQYLKAF